LIKLLTMVYPHNGMIKAAMRGKSDLVQKDGLNYLIPEWKRFVTDYSGKEDLMDEWLNSLDGRMIIDQILALLPTSERKWVEEQLSPIDNLFRSMSFETNECVWGASNEKSNGYNRASHWYYYRINEQLLQSEPGKYSRKTAQ